MIGLQLAAFAFLLGIVPTGLAATLLELGAQRPVTLSKPFFTRRHPFRSAGLAVLAGPFMAWNSLIFARRRGKLSTGACTGGAALCMIWMAGLGLVLAAMAGGLR